MKTKNKLALTTTSVRQLHTSEVQSTAVAGGNLTTNPSVSWAACQLCVGYETYTCTPKPVPTQNGEATCANCASQAYTCTCPPWATKGWCPM